MVHWVQQMLFIDLSNHKKSEVTISNWRLEQQISFFAYKIKKLLTSI